MTRVTCGTVIWVTDIKLTNTLSFPSALSPVLIIGCCDTDGWCVRDRFTHSSWRWSLSRSDFYVWCEESHTACFMKYGAVVTRRPSGTSCLVLLVQVKGNMIPLVHSQQETES